MCWLLTLVSHFEVVLAQTTAWKWFVVIVLFYFCKFVLENIIFCVCSCIDNHYVVVKMPLKMWMSIIYYNKQTYIIADNWFLSLITASCHWSSFPLTTLPVTSSHWLLPHVIDHCFHWLLFLLLTTASCNWLLLGECFVKKAGTNQKVNDNILFFCF